MSEKNKALVLSGHDFMVAVTKNIIDNLYQRGLLPLDEDFGKKVAETVVDSFKQYIDSQAEKKETVQ